MEDNGSLAKPQEFHVYSASATVQFKENMTRAGFNTLGLDFANKNSSGEGFNFDEKIVIQLTSRELPVLIAVALNLLPIATFKDRGKNKSKLQIRHQGISLFIKAEQGDKTVQLPIESFDAIYVVSLALSQLKKNYPLLTSDSVLEMLKGTVGIMGVEKQRRWLEKTKK